MINKTGFLPLFSIILLILCSCSPVPTQTVIPGIEQTLAVRTLVATQKLLYIATATPTPYQASVTPTATAANILWSDSSLMAEQTPVPR